MTSRAAMRDDAQACVRAYEALRSHVLAGANTASHAGLIVLLRQGVAAWMSAALGVHLPGSRRGTHDNAARRRGDPCRHRAGVGQHGPGRATGGTPMSSEAHQKVTASHLRRSAYLYVRQSTMRQVFENTESTQRQYRLAPTRRDTGLAA